MKCMLPAAIHVLLVLVSDILVFIALYLISKFCGLTTVRFNIVIKGEERIALCDPLNVMDSAL